MARKLAVISVFTVCPYCKGNIKSDLTTQIIPLLTAAICPKCERLYKVLIDTKTFAPEDAERLFQIGIENGELRAKMRE